MPKSTPTPRWILALPLLVLVAGICVWYFNRGYGKVSDKGYQFATALFSTCNRQDKENLKQIADMIDQSAASGELNQTDARVLQSIVSRGQSGNWSAASRETRRLMEAQWEPAPPLP